MATETAATMPNSLEAYWMPFTPNRQFKKRPFFVSSARGLYYTSTDGRQILDTVGGLWCVNAGHCHPRIVEAVQKQVATLDYAPTFNLGHTGAFEYAQRLTAIAPEHLNHVFMTTSGSEAVETALKIARAYQLARGQGQRQRLIGRQRAYHGVNFGGLSVGGGGSNRKQYGVLLPGTLHMPHTHQPDVSAFSRGQPLKGGVELADQLEEILDTVDASTVAAVIVEPVSGAGGVLIPPIGYLERLREICSRHDILLIFDEVVTGFGRLGTPFAADYFPVKPDLVTMAKGMSNGTVPMGGVLVSDQIHDTLMQGPENAVELLHGYTYSGHPLACAAAIATLEAYREDGIFENSAAMAPVWETAAHALKGKPHVKDIRTLGLLCGIDLESSAEGEGKRGKKLGELCTEAGVLVRSVGDTIILSPPLIIGAPEIERAFETIGAQLAQLD